MKCIFWYVPTLKLSERIARVVGDTLKGDSNKSGCVISKACAELRLLLIAPVRGCEPPFAKPCSRVSKLQFNSNMIKKYVRIYSKNS